MADTKKYLDLVGLRHYDDKIKTYIADQITSVNNSIADFTDVKDKAIKSYSAWQTFLAGWPTTAVAPSLNELAATKTIVDNLANTHYTKAQVDAIVGTPAEGKTVVGMIGDMGEALGGRIKAIEDLGLEAGSTYAKAADLNALSGTVSNLSNTVDGKADKATSLAGYGIADAYTKDEVDGIKTNLEKYADQAELDAISASKKYVDDLKIADTYATKDSVSNLSNTVDGKADKATSLAGYGIADAYTKTEVDAAVKLAKDQILGIVDDATLTGAYDTLQEVAEWIESDTSGAAAMQKDIADLKSNKADKATTLAGYGITDAYTKDEVTAAIAGVKVSVVDAEGTYVDVKSSVDAAGRAITLSVDEQGLTDALDAKADKATTLAGYGIADAYTKSETYTKDEVNTAIAGVKVSVVDAEGTYVDVKSSVDAAGRAITLSVDEQGLTNALAAKASNDALTSGLAGKTSMSVDTDGNVTFTQGEITVSPITDSDIDDLF